MSRGASSGFMMFRPMVEELLNIEKIFFKENSKNSNTKNLKKIGASS
jgi:hypothetical protein